MLGVFFAGQNLCTATVRGYHSNIPQVTSRNRTASPNDKEGPCKYLTPKSAALPPSQEFFLYIPESDSDCCSYPETLMGSLQKDPIVIFLPTDYGLCLQGKNVLYIAAV